MDLYIASLLVYSCLLSIFVQVYRPLPPGEVPIAVNKYHRNHHRMCAGLNLTGWFLPYLCGNFSCRSMTRVAYKSAVKWINARPNTPRLNLTASVFIKVAELCNDWKRQYENIARLNLLNVQTFSANSDRFLNNINSTEVRPQNFRECRLNVYQRQRYIQSVLLLRVLVNANSL
jgi:hypothetical protein